ncbi:uncharacterized protein EV420DRAFT_1472325 [Desarmillaria tabescens]|uniref:Uncharacterized protein n=1 Tax=Armillaria tabescens TaxID=1929756 RepID=A0AA39U7Z5_ARMTA|nr:uncharacterized protein EV420DRAFT_1472325 [Desarmillaria tabescens]KAK0469020.1 hypothetical protein EV420DRAFT_1472325 [Desarmillaria tabescens]
MFNKAKAESSSATGQRTVGTPNNHQKEEDTSIAVAICGVSPLQVSDAFQAPRYKPDLPPHICDKITSNAPQLLESVLRQRWPVTSINFFPFCVPSPNCSGTNEPDCAVAFANRLGTGWMLALHSNVLAIHCADLPPLPGCSPPGQLPVTIMSLDVDVISLWMLLAIFTYVYNHDQTQLFSAIFGHVYPPWDPVPLFPPRQHRTSTPPLAIDDVTVENYARILRKRTTRMQRQMILNNVKGFHNTSCALKIVDTGLHDVVLIATRIVGRVANMDLADPAGLDDQDDLYKQSVLLG